MSHQDNSQAQTTIAALRRFVRPKANLERCDMCSAGLTVEHSHLLEPTKRQLVCACEACALLFSGGAGTKYRRVPRRVRFLKDFQLSDPQWDGLMIPIQLAFFFHSTPAAKVIAMYPSPAGATESLLALEAWDEVVGENAVLKSMESDVEALLVNRVGDKKEYYIAPIDSCYELVGLIRSRWHGFSGGQEVWQAIEDFFTKLKRRAGVGQEAMHA
jgi:hypothetical protein